MRGLVILLSILVLAGTAMAKPSDWDDVVEKPGQKSTLPPPSKNAPRAVTQASASEPTQEPATKKRGAKAKAKAKTKKAPRRGKVKPSHR